MSAERCITCGDEGLAMRVLRLDADRGLALCEAADGRRATVETGLVDAAPGDEVLVHACVAIANLTETAA